MELLNSFYNSPVKNEVKEYLNTFIENYTIKKVFSKEDVSGIAEAKQIIDQCFIEMGKEFGEKPSKKVIDQSR